MTSQFLYTDDLLNRLPAIHKMAEKLLTKDGFKKVENFWIKQGKTPEHCCIATYTQHPTEKFWLLTILSSKIRPFVPLKNYTDVSIICSYKYNGCVTDCVTALAYKYLDI